MVSFVIILSAKWKARIEQSGEMMVNKARYVSLANKI